MWEELGVVEVETGPAVRCTPWTRPRISEKMLAKATRSLPGVLGTEVAPEDSNEGARLEGSND